METVLNKTSSNIYVSFPPISPHSTTSSSPQPPFCVLALWRQILHVRLPLQSVITSHCVCVCVANILRSPSQVCPAPVRQQNACMCNFWPRGLMNEKKQLVCMCVLSTCANMLFFFLSLLFVDVCEPGTLCVFGSQISEWSPATASEEGQRSRRILSQYGSRSYSSAAQRLATLSPFVGPAKDSSRVNNSAFKPINKAFLVCVPNTHI